MEIPRERNEMADASFRFTQVDRPIDLKTVCPAVGDCPENCCCLLTDADRTCHVKSVQPIRHLTLVGHYELEVLTSWPGKSLILSEFTFLDAIRQFEGSINEEN